MNSRRERGNRAALFDGIEEGGIRALPSYSSHEIDEQENERALDGLQDRVNLLKRLSGDVHEEVETHNRMLDRMGNDMDASRGILAGTMDKFKMVFETKSSRRMVTLVASFVVLFLVVYYLTRRGKAMMCQHYYHSVLAHDSIAQGIREVKATKKYINSLLKLKSLSYMDTTSTPQLLSCVEGVEGNMDELEFSLYAVKHLRPSEMLSAYSQSLQQGMEKTQGIENLCKVAFRDVEDGVFISLLQRKLKHIFLIVDDVVYRLSQLDAARRA